MRSKGRSDLWEGEEKNDARNFPVIQACYQFLVSCATEVFQNFVVLLLCKSENANIFRLF